MPTTGTFGGFNFDSDVFGDYVSERDPINSLLINSGVVVSAPSQVTSALNGKNNVTTIPYYVPFEGDALNYDGETDNVPVTLSGKKLTAMAYRRMKAWEEQDFTHELTGANDLANVASSIGKYQAKQNQKTLLSIFKGLEGVSAFASHINNTAITTDTDVVDANKLTPDSAMIAMQKALGDHLDEFQMWFMHSAVYLDLVRQGFANDVTIKAGTQSDDPFAKYFLNKPVIIDDTMTYELNETTGEYEYHTYLCGSGFIMTCPVRIDVPYEVDRDPQTNGGVTKLYTKWGRLLHPYGFSFDAGSVAKESPTNTEFADSALWEMKYNTKNIPFVAFVTNVSA